MTATPPPLNLPDTTKAGLNTAAAAVLALLSLWMTWADFAYPGDLLFQTSSSFFVALLVLSALFVAALPLAIFPKRMVIGTNLLFLSRLSYGFPLSIGMDSSTAARITSLLLLALALTWLVLSLKKRLRIGTRPWFQLKNTLIMLGAWILTGILSIPMVLAGAGYGTRSLLGDYTKLSHKGVTLVERVFEKDGRQVFLVGMMHVGDGSYYRDLQQRMAATPTSGDRRLVLMEGVSDEQALLPTEFANGNTYAKLAAAFGLEAQKSLQPGTGTETHAPAPPPADPDADIVWQNADIDISELEPRHQKLLVAMLGIFSGGNLREMLLADLGDATGEDLEDLFKNALIGARNQVLIERFDRMAGDFTEVYIPWGAAHLPDLETRLLSRGYTQSSETTRPIVSFWN